VIGRLLARLRRYLVTGLIVVAPLGATAWVLAWLFRNLDSLLGRYIREIPALEGIEIPGLGLAALVLLLVFVGWMLRWALGRKLVGWWNSVLSRLPMTRTVYNASSQIAQSVLHRDEKLFQKCVLIEYPSPGTYAMGFLTARAPREVDRRLGGSAVSVFLPTAPNPTSGYLLVLPEERVQVLEMSVEQGMKLILSAGVVVPSGDDRPLAGLDLERLAGRVDSGVHRGAHGGGVARRSGGAPARRAERLLRGRAARGADPRLGPRAPPRPRDRPPRARAPSPRPSPGLRGHG